MNIKLLSKNAVIPTRGTDQAAGYDLYAALDEPMIIPAHETRKVPTDIAAEIPEGYFGAIFARSGLSTKKGLRPANCVGVIDPDYRGNILVALHNDLDRLQPIEPGERIAQFVVIPYLSITFDIVDELSDTKRGDGGFGSTGNK